MSAKKPDVLVIGGGLHGLSAALHLNRAGQRVTILERSWVGRHASGSTAAGVRTLNRHLAEVPISLEAMDMWRNMEAIVGDDCGFHPFGQINVAEFESHLPVLEKRLETMRAAGYEHEEIIDRDELMRLVPTISPHCTAALIARRDGAADPHRTIAAFRSAAEAECTTIVEGCRVIAIERAGADWKVSTDIGHYVAPVVVNAAGAWAADIAAMIGDHIPLGHKASMMIVTERIAPLLKPVVSVVGRPLSFKQTDQGTLVIGGGLQGRADIPAQKSFVDFNELAKGARAAADLFPCIGPLRIVRTWAGMEAKTEDYLPVIGASPGAQGVYHAFGFSGHGFQLVPVVGAILADLIVYGGTNRQIEAFAPSRLMKQWAVV
ncbi:NAD(P)/FAD-dependent oxidoreductase [Agrobacterium rubi]|uniref:FAD-binding oxidoreductase n=1 Tax=Agrobacterium rubi TaxID=28099 RepID=A0ABX2JEP1_9HYPH|nr:FAD-binding oxidoreductase [Agrobacterium rubi]NTE89368.1 FAD-binding oxidoreductase [Agrobacterium rubi]NTF39504.1 FAD-binding oxidoreductase [Agrobacterium rubi]